MSVPFQHQLNTGELLSQNWFTGEHQVQVHGRWAGSDGFSGPSQTIMSESNADQSLFSVLSQSAGPLGYLGGRDAITSLMANDMGWMNLPHQNSALHDLVERPYLRSLNQ
ncbi:hypothetical protein PTKIN_Ptkin08bG0001800 [Pterospermum kingtungense]